MVESSGCGLRRVSGTRSSERRRRLLMNIMSRCRPRSQIMGIWGISAANIRGSKLILWCTWSIMAGSIYSRYELPADVRKPIFLCVHYLFLRFLSLRTIILIAIFLIRRAINGLKELCKSSCSILSEQHFSVLFRFFCLFLGTFRLILLELLQQWTQYRTKRRPSRLHQVNSLIYCMSQRQGIPHGQVNPFSSPRTHQVCRIADERGARIMNPRCTNRKRVQGPNVNRSPWIIHCLLVTRHCH